MHLRGSVDIRVGLSIELDGPPCCMSTPRLLVQFRFGEGATQKGNRK